MTKLLTLLLSTLAEDISLRGYCSDNIVFFCFKHLPAGSAGLKPDTMKTSISNGLNCPFSRIVFS